MSADARAKERRAGAAALLLASALAVAGCSALGLGGGDVETSGFLDDYSQLKKGGEGRARLIYIDASADFSGFGAMLIDPVYVWDPRTSAPAMSPPASLRDQARRFDAALREQLGADFELVDRPGPGTLRLRVSLTDSKTPGLTIEVEVLDAASGRRLVAAVDHHRPDEGGEEGGNEGEERGGDDAAGAAGDANRAIDVWAEVIRARLVAFRDFDRAQQRSDAQPSS